MNVPFYNILWRDLKEKIIKKKSLNGGLNFNYQWWFKFYFFSCIYQIFIDNNNYIL
jgi:hypothetical protein